ncbi:hypothetical protein JOH52_002871 [Sinorhizobium meliloti]|nr:hypothetical protein [Sinorhizobium meliloti]GEC38291.1 hypothetical protein EME01_23630 [Sinorhizobium meliloti]
MTSRCAAADIDEIVALARGEQQPAEVAGHGRRLEADDHEAIPALAGDLLPPLAPAGPIGLLDMLGDDAFEAVLAGDAEELVAIGLNLFR